MSKLSKLRKKQQSQQNKTTSETQKSAESPKSLRHRSQRVIKRSRTETKTTTTTTTKTPSTILKKKVVGKAIDSSQPPKENADLEVKKEETPMEEQQPVQTVESQPIVETSVVEENTDNSIESSSVEIESPSVEKEYVVVEDEPPQQTEQKEEPKEKKDPRLEGLGKAVIAPPRHFRNSSTPSKTSPSSVKEQGNSEPKRGGKEWEEREKGKTDRLKSKSSKGKNRRSKQKNWSDDIETKEEPRQIRRKRKNKRNKLKPIASPKAKAIKRRVMVNETITVANLAHEMSIKVGVVIKKLLDLGQMSSINDELDVEIATLVAEEFEFEVVDTSFQEEDSNH